MSSLDAPRVSPPLGPDGTGGGGNAASNSSTVQILYCERSTTLITLAQPRQAAP